MAATTNYQRCTRRVIVRDMMREFGVSRAVAIEAQRAFYRARIEYGRDYGGHVSHAVVAGLEAAQSVLAPTSKIRFSGVEGVCGQAFADCANPPSMFDSGFSYLNSGDVYRPTLAYVDDRAPGRRLIVTTYGDEVAKLERKYGGR